MAETAAEVSVKKALKDLAEAAERLATARAELQHERDVAQYDRMVAANKYPNKG